MTMSAVKEKRRPPFTTLATRFTLIVRSSYCDSGIALQLQSGLSGGFGDRRDPSVVQETAAIEDDAGHARRPGTAAEQLAHRRGGGDVCGRVAAQLCLVGRCVRQGVAVQ